MILGIANIMTAEKSIISTIGFFTIPSRFIPGGEMK